ncbi:lipopolysaccharide biosynthesis protein [Thalassotalea piscium]
MGNRSKVIRHTSLTTIANLAHAASQWLLLVIIVKQFDELILGSLVLTLSVVSPIFLLFSFKLRSLIVTDFHNKHTFEQYVNARIFAQLFIVLLLCVIAPSLLPNVPLVIIISVITFKVFDGISELCYSYLHKKQEFSRAALSQTLRSACTILALIVSTSLSQDISFTFSVWSAVTCLFALIDLAIVAGVIKNSEQRRFALQRIFFSLQTIQISLSLYKKYWPIGISIAFGAMFVYIPNYILESYHGTKAVGQFAAISYFLVAGGILINSLSQAATPKLSTAFNLGQHQVFIRGLLKLMLFGILIGVIGLIIASTMGTWLLSLIYNDSIAQLTTELQLIIFASLIRYSYIFLGAGLNVLHCFNQQTIVYGIGTAGLTCACLLLVPTYGTLGASIAMVIACTLELLVMSVIFIKNWQRITQQHNTTESTAL